MILFCSQTAEVSNENDFHFLNIHLCKQFWENNEAGQKKKMWAVRAHHDASLYSLQYALFTEKHSQFPAKHDWENNSDYCTRHISESISMGRDQQWCCKWPSNVIQIQHVILMATQSGLVKPVFEDMANGRDPKFTTTKHHPPHMEVWLTLSGPAV